MGVMSDERLTEIEACSTAATSPPWQSSPSGWVDRVPHPSINRRAFETAADAEFVAHAREDVPDLIAEVRRLKRALRLSQASRGIPAGEGRD